MPLSKIEEIIDDIRLGKMVILMDDEDRENEGDFIMAASMVRPEDINYMARFGRGLICLTLTPERCRQLRLPLMVSDTNAKHATNFTVSIEAAQGVTTGISAADRAVTIHAAVAPEAKPEDITTPGHIFPLMAQPGGVLTRAGHTEAGCDLARLAGFEAASVIVEILNEDGSMARRPDLEKLAQQHDLKMGTVADLIRYRLENEKTVERVSECQFPTRQGDFRLCVYQDKLDQGLHYALVMGEVGPDAPVMVRVHVCDFMADVLGDTRSGRRWMLSDALDRIAQEGSGVVVMLRGEEDNRAILHRIRDYQLQDRGVVLPRQDSAQDLRTYGFGAQILADLGVRKIRALSAPRKAHGISGFGLEVVEYIDV